MARAIPVGNRYDIMPVAPIPEATTYIPLRSLSIGVEYRQLTDDLIDAAFTKEMREASGIEADRPVAGLDDCGVSIHVCDADSGKEYVRFDNFGDDPHYHYIYPGSHNVVVPFDYIAHGDFLPWAYGRLRNQLPGMLRQAGANDLADRVEAGGGLSEDELTQIDEEVQRALKAAGVP
jgi:hypothetical protein